MSIKTEPPGAELLINDKRVGKTPYAAPFLWYGSYRFTMTKAGYDRLDKQVPIRAPVYFWLPLDLVMELLPFRIRDHREFAWELTPSEPLAMPIPPEPPPEPEPPPVADEPVQEEPPAAEPAPPLSSESDGSPAEPPPATQSPSEQSGG